MTFGILALGFPVSRFCRVRSLWGLTGSLSSLFFPILMHSLGDVWHPGSGVPCFGGFGSFAAFGGSQSHFLRYLHAFLRWRLASWLWGSLFRMFWKFRSLGGLTVSLSSLFFPVFMHSLGDVWHPGSGVPCFGGFAGFAAFGGSQSHSLPYLHAFLRWRLASWLWGSLFRMFWRFRSLWGLTVSLSSIFFPILMHSLGDVCLALGFPVSRFCRFRSLWGLTGSLSSLFFPILMHSLGDVWHGSGVPCFGGFGGFAAFGGWQSHFLRYLNAFLRWRLASWLWGSLFRMFSRFRSLWGLTVSLSSLFFLVLMHSLGDVWHPGSGVPCFGGFGGFAAFGGWQSHFLRYLNAFLRWRLASWLWGSLFRMFSRFRSLWGLTVSLSSLFFLVLMHSLGDVWHPGSGAPCLGGFGGFAAFEGSQSHSLPYLHAFLRWRLASWLWGSLFRRFWRFRSLWGLTVSLSSIFFPILMHSLGDVCLALGFPVSEVLQVSQPLGAQSLTFFAISMHSLGDVWHPGSGVPCLGGFGSFAAFGGSQSHFLSIFFPILMHSLGDVWHSRSGVPCFEALQVSQPLGAHSLTFFPILPYLNAFLRWRFASWLSGFPVSEVLQVSQPLGAQSLTFFAILMHSLGDVWHPGSGVPCVAGFRVSQPLGADSLAFFPILPYLNAFLRWRLASWLWGSLFRRFWSLRSLWILTVSLSSLS